MAVGTVEPRTKCNYTRICVCKHKNRFWVGMARQRFGDKLCLPTARRGGNHAPVDRKDIEVILRH
jgi:hypothetical protein